MIILEKFVDSLNNVAGALRKVLSAYKIFAEVLLDLLSAFLMRGIIFVFFAAFLTSFFNEKLQKKKVELIQQKQQVQINNSTT